MAQSNEQGTDTNQASELYELCKEVYKRTGWQQKGTRMIFNDADDGAGLYKHLEGYLYTSDYLLEKLPNGQRVVKVDEAYYVANNVQGLTDVNADGKSALVALLKFTLFLNKEGLL